MILERLSREDLQTPTWHRLEAHIRARIDALREQNDGDLDERKTQRLRGRIAELKNLLALTNPSAPATSGGGSE